MKRGNLKEYITIIGDFGHFSFNSTFRLSLSHIIGEETNFLFDTLENIIGIKV